MPRLPESCLWRPCCSHCPFNHHASTIQIMYTPQGHALANHGLGGDGCHFFDLWLVGRVGQAVYVRSVTVEVN